MIEFPSVDDWFQLARRYPDHKKPNVSILKDYGVMRCIQHIEDTFGWRGKDMRMMEFGHGFNPQILSRFQDKHEVWGADRDQKLTYFGKDFDWDANFARDVAPHTKNVHFARELLSRSTEHSTLPDNYFDCICSVSVLEEVGLETVADVVGAAFDKLRPGGLLIGTHDVRFEIADTRMPAYIDVQRATGFQIAHMPTMPALNPWRTLVENCGSVMVWYQGAEAEESRKYWGHFGTCFTVAQKPH